MTEHDCQYAKIIGKKPEWQTDAKNMTVCRYCHTPKNPAVATKATAKTVRK